MTAVSGKPKKLSNLQATLLQVFDQNLSDDELVEIKSLLSNYFYEKAQQEADRVIAERNQTLETLNEEVEAMENNNRTYYLKQMQVA